MFRWQAAAWALATGCSLGCSKDPPRPSARRAPQEATESPSLDGRPPTPSADGGGAELPLDPPSPAGDLRAEVERFTSLDACVAERGALDPVLSDAVLALGYDTFVVDACRGLEALKLGDRARCGAIGVSALRARCETAVAIYTASPDGCPMDVPGQPALGRDPLCVAAATRTSRLCAAAGLERQPRCEALVSADEGRCERAPPKARAACRRDVGRWRGVMALGADAGLGAMAGAIGKVHVEPLGESPPLPERDVDATPSLHRGVVLVEGPDGTHLSMGWPITRDSLFFAASPVKRVDFTVGVLASRGEARVEEAQLTLPAAPPLLVPPSTSRLTAKLVRLDRRRGGEVHVVVDGEIGAAPRGYRVHADLVTYVRDIVGPDASGGDGGAR